MKGWADFLWNKFVSQKFLLGYISHIFTKALYNKDNHCNSNNKNFQKFPLVYFLNNMSLPNFYDYYLPRYNTTRPLLNNLVLLKYAILLYHSVLIDRWDTSKYVNFSTTSSGLSVLAEFFYIKLLEQNATYWIYNSWTIDSGWKWAKIIH